MREIVILQLAVVSALTFSLPSQARSYTADEPAQARAADGRPRPFFQRHPLLRKMIKGAGLGIVTGGAAGVLLGGGLVHGAALGAGKGAAVSTVKHKWEEDKNKRRLESTNSSGRNGYTQKTSTGVASAGKEIGKGVISAGKGTVRLLKDIVD